MAQQTAISTNLSSALIVGAMSVGSLAAVGLGPAPTAGATCASFFGFGNSANCSSTLTTVAIAIGTNAQATALGQLGGAFVIGNDSIAQFQSGVLGIAIGLGTNSITTARGFADIAVNLTTASAEHTLVGAAGTANIAVNIFGGASTVFGHNVGAFGIGNIAFNVFGSDNTVSAGTTPNSFGNTAINAFGHDNEVRARGPLSLAGAFGQSNVVIEKTRPGFNLAVQVGPAASTRPMRKAAPRAVASKTSNVQSRERRSPTRSHQ